MIQRVSLDVRWWIAGLLPMVVVMAGAAGLGQRYQPMAAVVVAMMLASIAAMPLLSRGCHWSPDGRLTVSLLFGLWLWLGIANALVMPERVVGWWQWGERAAQLLVLILVAGSGQDPARSLRLLGFAASITLLVVLLVNMSYGYNVPGDTRCWAFGHINILVNTVGPSILGWVIIMLWSRQAGRLEWAAATVGALCLAVAAVSTQRRGVPLALVGGLALLGWRWWSMRSPRVAWAVLLVLGIFATVAVVLVVTDSGAVGTRMQRLLIYRAAMELFWESPWTGHGQFGALGILSGSGEAMRHCRASGWGTHVHSEPIELLLDGGIIGMAIGLAAVVFLWRHIRKSTDAASWSVTAAMGAVVVHACTDNVYGTEIGGFWLAMWVGIALQQAGPRDTSAGVPNWALPRRLGWILVVPAVGCIITALPSATAHADAMPSVHMRALRSSLHPLDLVSHANRMGDIAAASGDSELLARAIFLASSRVGWVPDLALLELKRAVLAGEPDAMSAAAVRVIRLDPFQMVAYPCLLEGDMDPVSRRRLGILRGTGAAQALMVPEIADVDQAADVVAALTALRNGAVRAGRLDQVMAQLLDGYGDISAVAVMALEVALWEPGSGAWAARHRDHLVPVVGHPRIVEILANAPEDRAAHMAAVIDQVCASAVLPAVVGEHMRRLRATTQGREQRTR